MINNRLQYITKQECMALEYTPALVFNGTTTKVTIMWGSNIFNLLYKMNL